MESELRKHSCCFTGHRPEKMSVNEQLLRQRLEYEIRKAIGAGYRVFITGMAPGVDLLAGEIVLQLRNSGLPLKLVAAVPYLGFGKKDSSEWRQLYQSIIEAADHVEYISKHYSRSCFQKRNIWMVDRSSLVLAAYNGSAGGTRNTIVYANKCGVPVVNVLDNP